jgi:hypothetical protein
MQQLMPCKSIDRGMGLLQERGELRELGYLKRKQRSGSAADPFKAGKPLPRTRRRRAMPGTCEEINR